MEKDIPRAGQERDELLLRLMGSPDIKQIDGLGGGTSVTSKVAILAPSRREDADVDYTFAQVAVDKALVSYKGNCGNISSGVGPFAIESGLVKAAEGTTTVRVYNTNTQKVMIESVQTADGKVVYDGNYAIAGVPGTAAPVEISVLEPGGTMFGALLPTGKPEDVLEVPGLGSVKVSIVDVANPLVFVDARSIGMTGVELPSDIDKNPGLLSMLENIRGMAAQTLGLVKDYKTAANVMPGIPKLAIVAPPMDYVTVSGREVCADQINLVGRMMSMQKTHPTYAMTGAMCTAAAAVIEGTIVNKVCTSSCNKNLLLIGHPEGVFEAGVEYRIDDGGSTTVLKTYAYRTARLLMRGTAYC